MGCPSCSSVVGLSGLAMADPVQTKLRLSARAVPRAMPLVRHRAGRSAVERWPISLVAKAGVPSSSPPTELADGFGPEVALPLQRRRKQHHTRGFTPQTNLVPRFSRL